MRRAFLILFLFGALLGLAEPAHAQTLDRIVDLYKNNARNWEATLNSFALQLFWLLAAIEFSWAALSLAFRAADLAEWLAELVSQIFFIGFFFALLTHSAEWARAVIDSFREAAAAAARANGVSVGLAPSDIFGVGLDLASNFVGSTSLWSPAASLALFVAALIIIVCFALIAAEVIMTLVETYVVISAGVIFMGFGGSRWTKDFAIKMAIYAVAAGAKLFILHLVIALGMQIFRALGTGVANDNVSLFVIIGSAIVMWIITKTVPAMVQTLFTGVQVGAGGPMFAAAVMGAAAGVAGGAMAARGAGRLASAQLEEADLDAPQSRPTSSLGRAARWGKAAVGNLVGGLITNAGDRISGRAHFGTRLGQTANNLDAQATTTRGRVNQKRQAKAQPKTEQPADGEKGKS